MEFAIVAFALYLILAALLTFGRAIFAAQVLQQSADVFAHELARTPLPPTETLAHLFRPDDGTLTAGEQQVRATLFDESRLEIDITAWQQHDGGLTLDQYLEQQHVPLVNRLLAPLMIVDQRDTGTFLWYPGATLRDAHYYVYTLHGTGVAESPVLDWAAGDVDEPAGAADPFTLAVDANGNTAGGLAQVRLNYAFQSASLSATRYPPSAGGTLYVQSGEAAQDTQTRGGLYRGTDNLGQQHVAGMVVRPFQLMISAQAVYRREAYAP